MPLFSRRRAEMRRRLGQEFHGEVTGLSMVLGLKRAPKYKFVLGRGHIATVFPRWFRRPKVKIGERIYAERPEVLAGEAGHIVFDAFRKERRLTHVPTYGDVFDFMNKIRFLHRTGNHEVLDEHLRSFHTMDPFLDRLQRFVDRASRNPQPGHTENMRLRAEMARLYGSEMDRYGTDNISHITAMAFLRLALRTGMRDPEHVEEFMRRVAARDSRYGARMFEGDFTGLKEELEFFSEEPKRVMAPVK